MPFNPGMNRRLNALGGKRPQATGIAIIPKNNGLVLKTSEGSVNNFGGNSKFGLYPNVGMSYAFQNRYSTGSMFSAQVHPSGNGGSIPAGAKVFVRNQAVGQNVNYAPGQLNLEIPQFKGWIRQFDEQGNYAGLDGSEHFVEFKVVFKMKELNYDLAEPSVGWYMTNPIPLKEFITTYTFRNCSRAYADHALNILEKIHGPQFPGQSIFISMYYTGTFLNTPLPIRLTKITDNYASKYYYGSIASWHEDHPDNAGANPGDWASGDGPFSITWLRIQSSLVDAGSEDVSYYKLNDDGHHTGYNAQPLLQNAGMLSATNITDKPFYGGVSALFNGVGHDALYEINDPAIGSTPIPGPDGVDNLSGNTLQVTLSNGYTKQFRAGLYPNAIRRTVRPGDEATVAAGTDYQKEAFKLDAERWTTVMMGVDQSCAPAGATVAAGNVGGYYGSISHMDSNYIYLNQAEWPTATAEIV